MWWLLCHAVYFVSMGHVALELAPGAGQTGGMTAPIAIAILRIELEDIEPLIWRRVAVRATTSLAGLHRIIQAAMGWTNSHLHLFTIDGSQYGVPDDEWIDGNARF